MKHFRLCLLIGGFLTVLSGPAPAQHLLADDFVYPVADSIESVSPWDDYTLTPHKIRIVSPGLTFPGHVGSGVGNAVFLSNLPGGDIVKRIFPTRDSGDLFLSFLLEVDSLTPTATAGYVTCVDQEGGPTNHSTRATIRRVSPNAFNLGIVKITGSPVFGGEVYGTDTTYLVVVKYTWVSGTTTDDTAKIFVFRSSLPATEPEGGTFTANGTDAINAGEVIITNSYAYTGLAGSPVRIDAIRVGTTWAGALLSDARPDNPALPHGFSLDQNYPNPFNPGTTIRYVIGDAVKGSEIGEGSGDRGQSGSWVRLVVYNLLGQEVAVLVNERQSPGEYQARFDRMGLASGVYVYRLTSGSFVESRMMVALR